MSSSENTGKLSINPQWVPPDDPVFQHLLQEAVDGRLPVYFAAVPLSRLRRHSPSFHPELTHGGSDVVSQIMARWHAGDFAKIWVYPAGQQFVVADDYFVLAAAEKGQPDFLPCWILGNVPEGYAKDVQGPIPVDWVRKTLLSAGG